MRNERGGKRNIDKYMRDDRREKGILMNALEITDGKRNIDECLREDRGEKGISMNA